MPVADLPAAPPPPAGRRPGRAKPPEEALLPGAGLPTGLPAAAAGGLAARLPRFASSLASRPALRSGGGLPGAALFAWPAGTGLGLLATLGALASQDFEGVSFSLGAGAGASPPRSTKVSTSSGPIPGVKTVKKSAAVRPLASFRVVSAPRERSSSITAREVLTADMRTVLPSSSAALASAPASRSAFSASSLSASGAAWRAKWRGVLPRWFATFTCAPRSRRRLAQLEARPTGGPDREAKWRHVLP
mmetsp:Transcript_46237/g.104415  ORF Transcript_46237/g.104415 Transcript_46237/m.104415 type:complete len:247 (-) Transcript_46237:524-1264(-)